MRISKTLKMLLGFNKIEKTTSNHEIARINRSNIIEGLGHLERDFLLLEPNTIKRLEDKILKQPLRKLIKNVDTILAKELESAIKNHPQN